MKVTSEGKRGRGYLIWKISVLMIVAFAKIFIGVENWKKKIIQNSCCLDKNYGSLFLDIVENVFWHFSLILFLFPSPSLFSKKQKNKTKKNHKKSENTQNKNNKKKRRKKEILLLMLCEKSPSTDCSAVRT